MIICKNCSKNIYLIGGYLSDFYPDMFSPRDRTEDCTIYGIRVDGEIYEFCSEKCRGDWLQIPS